jgi:hypothetical protein
MEWRKMTKQLCLNFGVALLAVTSVYAQESRILANVPFGFYAGSSLLPSGEYTVDTAAPGVVRLRSADGKSSAMIQTIGVQTFGTPSDGKLVFNRYGGEYYLSQVWKPGDNTGREFQKTQREIEVAAKIRRGSEAVIAKR